LQTNLFRYLMNLEPEKIEELEKRLGIREGEGRCQKEEEGRRGFILSDIIVNEYREKGYKTVITFGAQRVGKSIYNIKVAMDVFRRLGWELSWQDLIDRYVIFDATQLVDTLMSEKQFLPVIVWDDAGVHGSSYLFFTNKRKVMLLSWLFQTIGVKTASLMANTPNPMFILKHFRSVDSILVLIHKLDRKYSVARGYRWYLMPSGEMRLKRLFIEEFLRSMPEYDYYLEKRKGYTDYSLRMLKEAITEEMKKKKPARGQEVDRLIAEMLAEGHSYRKIARTLHVSTERIAKVKKMLEAGLIGPRS